MPARVQNVSAAVLLSLQVRDLAIIDATEVSFGPGMNIVTGETGAGKSILIDALLLALGGRAMPDMVRLGAAQAEVSALFDIEALPQVRARLLDAGIECEKPRARGAPRGRVGQDGQRSLSGVSQRAARLADAARAAHCWARGM
jgi:DNA repair protein RecN (Recombination protein N)